MTALYAEDWPISDHNPETTVFLKRWSGFR